MFYIVEQQDKLNQLEIEISQSGCYVDVIASNSLFHPKLSHTVAVYVRPLTQDHGYIIPVDHGEGMNVSKDRVYRLLKSSTTLYTLNKKNLLYHFNLQDATDISLLYSMNNFERLEYSVETPTIDWFYRKHANKSNLNSIIPITKLYEKCELVYCSIERQISLDIPPGFDFYNSLATNVFFLLEQKGIGVDKEKFVEAFSIYNPLLNTTANTVFSSYNLYNNTSRPTNNFNSVNFAAIPKNELHRKSFKPKNDFFGEFDFDGYHLRLLAQQINYPLTDESAHKQLAEYYFKTQDITQEQYLQAKQINFQAIYGRIPKEYSHLEIFKKTQQYIDTLWKQYTECKFVTNPQSGKTFTDKLPDMNPAKLMNYMMQSLETSNNIAILKEVLRLLKDKKTFISLYTYDSIILDFSKEDKKETLEEIKNIMEQGGKYPVKFKYSKDLML